MTAALTRVAPALRTVGITIDQPPREAGTRRRLWTLAEQSHDRPSQPAYEPLTSANAGPDAGPVGTDPSGPVARSAATGPTVPPTNRLLAGSCLGGWWLFGLLSRGNAG